MERFHIRQPGGWKVSASIFGAFHVLCSTCVFTPVYHAATLVMVAATGFSQGRRACGQVGLQTYEWIWEVERGTWNTFTLGKWTVACRSCRCMRVARREIDVERGTRNAMTWRCAIPSRVGGGFQR